MKNTLILVGAMCALLCLVLLFRAGKTAGYESAAEEYQWKLDTIQAVCSEIPDTVRTSDTVYNDRVVYVERYTPVSMSSGQVKEYYDTTKTEDLDFWVHDQVDGVIINRETGYNLKVPILIRDTTLIYKEVPRLIEVVRRESYKAYVRGSVGPAFYSVGYGLIMKDRHAVGLDLIYSDSKPKASISYTFFLRK